ncbi:MAG: YdcF family protein [bacterium]|nr:YdcF family protein [bacterium]
MPSLLAEVGVVHGAGLDITDGSIAASEASIAHAITASELVERGHVRRLLFSGHGPLLATDYATSEARLMRDAAVAYGVEPNATIIEEGSHSTLGNWVNSAKIIDEEGYTSAMGITGRAHIPRARDIGLFVADRCDFSLTAYSEAPTLNRPKDFAREAVMNGLTKYFQRKHKETDLTELTEEYERFMSTFKLDSVKRFLHRNKQAY